MSDVTGMPALLLMLLPLIAGLWFWSQSKDMVGLFVLGVCGFVFWSLLTTGNAPAPAGDPLLALVVFGGFLLVYLIDTGKKLGAVHKAAGAAGAKSDQHAAGCMGVVMLGVIVVIGAVIWFAVVGLQP